MTQAQEKLKKRLIAAIHCAPRYRNHHREDEEGYRRLLREHFGVGSSTEMSIDDLIELLAYMKMQRDSLEDRRERASSAQLHRLRELWARYARNPEERALLRFVARYHGAVPIRLELLEKKAAQKAIVALRKSLAKGGGDDHSA